MYDDRPLVDLINSRFDDMNQKISELKQDLIREVQGIKTKQELHEVDDQRRFDSFNKIKWQVSGAVITVAGIFKYLEHLFAK